MREVPKWRAWGPGGRCVTCGLQAQRCECIKPSAPDTAISPIPAFRNRIKELEAENGRMRKALETLEQWDMLSPGACGDGPWAKRLIQEALGRDSR